MDFKDRAVALVVCGAMTAAAAWACISTDVSGGTIYTEAANVKPGAVAMTVGGQDVRADMFLYWVMSDCSYITMYFGDSAWDQELSEGYTVQQYVMEDVQSVVSYYVAADLLAAENDCGLTEDQQAELDGLHDTYVSYYGDEETYASQLRYYGLTEDNMIYSAEMSYKLSNLYDKLLGEGGELEATDANVKEWAESSGYSSDDYTIDEQASYYTATDGAFRDYVDAYASTLEVVYKNVYNNLDLSTFYPAATAAQAALEA